MYAGRLLAKGAIGGICKGDAGGPVVRERGGRAELVALSGGSNGAGCFGSEVTGPAQATATRTDGLGSWVNRARLADRANQLTETVAGGADFNGDGRDDVVVRFKDGTLHVLYGGADGKLEYGRALWHDDSWKRAKQIAAGDFNGDGKGDVAAIWQDGTLRLYLGDNRGELAEDYKKMWPDDSVANMRIARYKVDNSGRDGLLMAWGSGYLHAYPTNADGTLNGRHWAMWNNDSWKTIPQFTTGDFNGDGKDDVVAIWGNGEFRWYPGNDKGTLDSARAMWHDTSWGTSLRITGGDFDGDGKSDVVRVSGGGEFQFYKGDGNGKLTFGSPMVPTLG
ncbi:FG-GAP repeat domain-containing protein [Streptomyces sp. NPDC090442]|uniref:FG-GAP repeat domain-containing protein n=1 Tax=Streptomyces sp. NPDC090442 TaxID=3365962 RepID=UPI00382C7989